MKVILRDRRGLRPRTIFAALLGQIAPGARPWREVQETGAVLRTSTSGLWCLLVGLLTSCTLAFGLGYGAGKLLQDPEATASAHASGACIALEMAAAHGAIDELERRMTLRALVTALNPNFGQFPEHASEITTVCDKLTKGAITAKVAR